MREEANEALKPDLDKLRKYVHDMRNNMPPMMSRREAVALAFDIGKIMDRATQEMLRRLDE